MGKRFWKSGSMLAGARIATMTALFSGVGAFTLLYWRPAQPLSPPALRRLLQVRGSFTAALRAAVMAPVTVQVLGERRLVGGSKNLSGRGRSLPVREVLLRTPDHALIYALTILPEMKRQGPLRELTSLAERPLGELLFNGAAARSGRATRISLQFARMAPGHWLRRKALAHGLDVPVGSAARCSCFLYKGRPLWVHELALAALPLALRAPVSTERL